MRLTRFKPVIVAVVLSVLTGGAVQALERSPVPQPRPYEIFIPDLRWDHTPKGKTWTKATMGFITSHGQRLTKTVPRDINEWCPGYPDQDTRGRAAFWAGLLSTLSYHESTWREAAAGGGGKWFGLTQIAPPTARWRKCRARTAEELKNGVANLSCAVRIMNITVPRDQVVSAGMKGVAADWGPFHSSSKREDMKRWLKRQDFCKVVMRRSPIPLPRPARLDARAVYHVPDAILLPATQAR
ncbi:transglycosylase SLT domain-containing protein [Celeribacter sp.]|uniref:transglycosylase SLT domain-containing protein n=1 Tax=Celeribacter sp. TaxID=1890673 RepID=UPI003A946B1C